jgi:hypothetical protein
MDDIFMSRRAAEFLEEWLAENAVRPAAGSADAEARLRTEECLRVAKEQGIAKEDIEEEVGDLSAYMRGAIVELMTRSEAAPSNTTEVRREQRIRTRAFYIWLNEGCPEERAEAHWDMATELVAIEDHYDVALKRVQDAPSTPAGEPVEPLVAIENAGEFPTLTDQGEESTYPHKRTSGKT